VGSPAARITARYEQRRPESTVLYRLVAEHLESFLAVARESTGRGLPRYVERGAPRRLLVQASRRVSLV
jgi:hypothetical protein